MAPAHCPRFRLQITADDLAARLAAAEAGDATAMCEVGCYYKSVGDASKAFAFHQRAVALGDGRACLMLGLALQQGAGTEVNMRESLSLFYRAAERGWWPALNELGRCFTRGIGVEKDFANAALMYERSAEHNNIAGITNLASCFAYGRGRPKDLPKAIALYERAAAAGSAVAMWQLGALYLDILKPPNYAKALEWLLKAADAGNEEAMYRVGTMYHSRQGVERNLKLAMAWYLKAYEKGHAAGAYELGRLLKKGIDSNREMQNVDRAILVLEVAFERKHTLAGEELGFIYEDKKDTAKAIEWHQRALDRPDYKKLSPLYDLLRASDSPADKKRAVEVALTCEARGSVDAAIELGSDYEVGRVFKKDLAMAFEWYKRGLRDEPNAADFYVAGCYLDGRGTQIDGNAAIKHYLRAMQVDDDCASAAAALGDIYYDETEGVPVDYNEALKYWRLAEIAGEFGCAVRIGACYELGRGVAKDYAEAVQWYSKYQDRDLRSLINLSRCARMGVGMAKDLGKAVDYLRQAVSTFPDDGECYCILALRLKEHQGAERDAEECLRSLQQSAERDSPTGMFHLGRAYETGDGVVPDTAQAMQWYEKAANLGYSLAKVEIGRHLFYGIGHTPRDEAKAFALWLEAAEASRCAALNVARCYEGGFGGVERSAANAAKWRRVATDHECPLCFDGVAADCCNV